LRRKRERVLPEPIVIEQLGSIRPLLRIEGKHLIEQIDSQRVIDVFKSLF
jgi:proteasome assembly chaperone (PAC2) family protein